MLFASQYFKDEKYDLLRRNAVMAANVTANNYAANNYAVIDAMITTAYSVLAEAVDAEILLVDLSGNILLSAGPGGRQQYTTHSAAFDSAATDIIASDIVARASTDGYQMTTTMNGFFQTPHYVVGVPVSTENGAVAVLFAATDAQGLNNFIVELTKMFIVSAIVVMLVLAVAIYVMTIRLISPLKDMLAATQSFSQGDFSKRVTVAGYDEMGQLAMAFNNMASTLATTEQTRRSFIANVSHELKTPMTTIGGFVDGILDGTIPSEKHDQYLTVVSNEVKRLSRLVRSMLDTARIEAGEMQVNPVIFDISEIIRLTVFTFEQGIEEKQLELRGLDADKILVRADEDLMHQVVYNLIENAVKFVDVGGYIEFRYRADGPQVFVAIRNSGEGIDRDEAPQLFERFYKSDKSRSLNKQGAGLGLHIVRSIINYHKGDITVRGVQGEYTEFEFSIPAAPKKELNRPS